MSDRKFRLVLKRLAIACCAIASLPANALNLSEAVQFALAQDATFQAARWDAQSIQKNRSIAAGGFYPQVSVALSQGRASFDREFLSGGQARTDSQRVGTVNNVLQLRQTLFSLDALARYRQASVQGDVADENLRKERQDLVVRVATAYIDVLNAYDIHQLSIVDERAAREQADTLQSAVRKGEAASTDAIEARARADIARVRLVEAGEQLEANVRALETLMGERITDLAGLNKAFDWKGVVAQPFDEWRDLAAVNNPELRVAAKTVEYFEREVERTMAGHAPRLDLVYSRSKLESDSVNTVGVKSEVDSAALQLQVPIFSGFAVQESVAQARLRLNKAQADRDATFRRISTDLFRQYTAARLASDKLTALDSAVRSADESVKAARLGVKTGLRVMVDVFTAQQKLYQARVDYAKGFYEAVLALLRLRAGAGALGDDDLQAVAQVFAANAITVRVGSSGSQSQ